MAYMVTVTGVCDAQITWGILYRFQALTALGWLLESNSTSSRAERHHASDASVNLRLTKLVQLQTSNEQGDMPLQQAANKEPKQRYMTCLRRHAQPLQSGLWD